MVGQGNLKAGKVPATCSAKEGCSRQRGQSVQRVWGLLGPRLGCRCRFSLPSTGLHLDLEVLVPLSPLSSKPLTGTVPHPESFPLWLQKVSGVVIFVLIWGRGSQSFLLATFPKPQPPKRWDSRCELGHQVTGSPGPSEGSLEPLSWFSPGFHPVPALRMRGLWEQFLVPGSTEFGCASPMGLWCPHSPTTGSLHILPLPLAGLPPACEALFLALC